MRYLGISNRRKLFRRFEGVRLEVGRVMVLVEGLFGRSRFRVKIIRVVLMVLRLGGRWGMSILIVFFFYFERLFVFFVGLILSKL